MPRVYDSKVRAAEEDLPLAAPPINLGSYDRPDYYARKLTHQPVEAMAWIAGGLLFIVVLVVIGSLVQAVWS